MTGEQLAGATDYRLSVREDDGTPHVVLLLIVDGWRVELRLALQNGRLVVGALDMQPKNPGVMRGLHASVPAGGITMRLLRHVPVHAHIQALADMLRRPPETQVLEALLIRTPAEVLLSSVRPPAAPVKTPRRGRRPISTETLLAVAVAYDKAVRRGSSAQPVVDAAKALRETPTRVRDLVHRARHRGLLTHAQWGRSGGELTPLALKILKRGKATKRGGRK